MLKTMLKMIITLTVFIGSTTLYAAETHIMTMKGQYGQFGYTPTADGWVAGSVSVYGTGQDKTAFMFHTSYTYADGYKFWRGNIPVEAVSQVGVSSIAVNVNTCDVEPLNMPGCGPVSFTVTTDEPATGWIDNGVSSYSYNDFMYQAVGARQVRFSSAIGSINGSAFNTSRAYMGVYNDVTISITVGN